MNEVLVVIEQSHNLIESATFILDLIGLFLISIFLFKVPNPIEFGQQTWESIGDLRDVRDALNKISRNMELVRKMRFGFASLVLSMFLKIILWWSSNYG